MPKWFNTSDNKGWLSFGVGEDGIEKKYYFKSLYEKNYARYLDFLREKNKISDWLYEPETFWFEAIKRGVRSYLPDFKIINKNGSIEYHEVKGFMDSKSQTKLKRMAKYYPDIKIRVIDSDWFKVNKALRFLIPGWEVGENRFKK